MVVGTQTRIHLNNHMVPHLLSHTPNNLNTPKTTLPILRHQTMDKTPTHLKIFSHPTAHPVLPPHTLHPHTVLPHPNNLPTDKTPTHPQTIHTETNK